MSPLQRAINAFLDKQQTPQTPAQYPPIPGTADEFIHKQALAQQSSPEEILKQNILLSQMSQRTPPPNAVNIQDHAAMQGAEVNPIGAVDEGFDASGLPPGGLNPAMRTPGDYNAMPAQSMFSKNLFDSLDDVEGIVNAKRPPDKADLQYLGDVMDDVQVEADVGGLLDDEYYFKNPNLADVSDNIAYNLELMRNANPSEMSMLGRETASYIRKLKNLLKKENK